MLSSAEKEHILTLIETHSIYQPWAEPELFGKIVRALAEPFRDLRVSKVVGLEARGFVIGGAVAYELGAGFAVVRKHGRMYQEDYDSSTVLFDTCIDYSGTAKVLEVEKYPRGVRPGDRVVLIDDWFETGDQGQAAVRLVRRAGAEVVGIGIMLDEMNGEARARFADCNFHALVRRER